MELVVFVNNHKICLLLLARLHNQSSYYSWVSKQGQREGLRGPPWRHKRYIYKKYQYSISLLICPPLTNMLVKNGQIFGQKWVRLAPNGTNSGISVHFGSASLKVLKSVYVPFGANLTPLCWPHGFLSEAFDL